jgi:polyhydroxybutyrate depolymerase
MPKSIILMKTFQLNKIAQIAFLLITGLTACNAKPAVIPTATAIPTITPLDTERTVTVKDRMRSYFMHIPKGITGQQTVPLVLVFHGYRESGTYARYYTEFDPIADVNGFIVTYPDGYSWNAGGCCGDAQKNNTDEPAFVRAIIADVETLVNVDLKRIYATGFSNGALLSYSLACQMSDTLAAVAPVDGALIYTPCKPQQPVSIIHVHGANDEVFPVNGGGVSVQFPSVEESLLPWVKLDGCSGDKQVKKDGVLTHTTYNACNPGIAVELYVVDGVDHIWTPPNIAPISQIIWDFFAAHPKP